MHATPALHHVMADSRMSGLQDLAARERHAWAVVHHRWSRAASSDRGDDGSRSTSRARLAI